MKRPGSALVRATVTSFALLATGGCGSDGDGDGATREVALADLPCASIDPVSGVWESAPFASSSECGSIDAGALACCPWIELPGHTDVRIEHALGATPRVVDPWIAFSSYGIGATIGSGDALRIQTADDTHIVLENHTDQRFYLRVDLR